LSDKKALPVVVYLHGGGFITSIGAASIVYHGLCSNLASHVQAIVISVEHRLAPEHRLPTASGDAMEATHIIKKIAMKFGSRNMLITQAVTLWVKVQEAT